MNSKPDKQPSEEMADQLCDDLGAVVRKYSARVSVLELVGALQAEIHIVMAAILDSQKPKV